MAVPGAFADLFNFEESFILGQSGDEPMALRWAGNEIVVPPINVIGVAGIGLYRCPAAKLDGAALPGTAVLASQMREIPETGGSEYVINASEWVRGIVSNNANLDKRGFFVTKDPTKVKDLQAKGREAWKVFERQNAVYVLQEELQRRKYYTDKGLPVPAGSNELSVTRAQSIVDSTRGTTPGISTEALLVSLGQKPAAPVAQAVPVAPQPVVQVEAVNPVSISQALVDECERAGFYLKRDVLISLLKGDLAAQQEVELALSDFKGKKAVGA